MPIKTPPALIPDLRADRLLVLAEVEIDIEPSRQPLTGIIEPSLADEVVDVAALCWRMLGRRRDGSFFNPVPSRRL